MKEAVYKGHGQIESYPLNSALWGVIAHEQRHANFNKYIASLKNEKVDQHIKVSIQFKDGQPVPVDAYTEANFQSENVKSEEKLLKLLFISFKISKLKKEASKDKKAYLEIYHLEKELKKIKSEIFKGQNIKKVLTKKKEYAEFYGIYDFEKFNIPPAIIHNPLSAGYIVQQHLNAEFKKYQASESQKIYDVISEKDSYVSDIENLWEKLFLKFSYFNDYLNNFSINYNSVSNDNEEYFEVEAGSNSQPGNFTIKISNIAKSLIVYSKKFDDAYSALNISGIVYINGVEVDIDTSDSLYDIAEKINWGEDLDEDGVLDYDEGEDINNNQELDGGTKEHGVYAYIEDNRLYLKNIETGDKKINIQDSDNIFHDFEIIKENPLNDLTYFPNIAQQGENALYSINGQEFTSESNTVDFNGITLSLKKITDSYKNFKIEEDLDKLYNEVSAFVNNYNYIIKSINNTLSSDNMHSSLTANIIKRGMKIAVFSDIDYNKDVTDIGMSLNESKSYLEELEILLQKDKKIFNNSVYKKLFSLGIQSNADETISLDKEKLLKNYKEVKDIFLSENGVINRLKNFVSKVIDEDNGIIALQLSNLNSVDIQEIKEFYNKEKIISDYLKKKYQGIASLIG